MDDQVDVRLRRTRSGQTPWYELFSRGARDWLRHNQKVREAVRSRLPEICRRRRPADRRDRPHGAGAGAAARALRASACATRTSSTGAGQGDGEAGRRAAARSSADPARRAPGGNGDGEMPLRARAQDRRHRRLAVGGAEAPDLKPKRGARRGSRLHARRLGQARRALAPRPPPHREGSGEAPRRSRRTPVAVHQRRPALPPAGEAAPAGDQRGGDLRARRLGQHGRSASASSPRSSSSSPCRASAASTARWRPCSSRHTAEAWEFNEEPVLPGIGGGGTVASSALHAGRARSCDARYDPGRYNIYLFYASDGENASTTARPRGSARASSRETLNYAGYVETASAARQPAQTEIAALFAELQRAAGRAAACRCPRRTTCGARSAISSAEQAKPMEMSEADERRHGYARRHRGARARLGPRLLPGRLRAVAREPHDRDRGLRPAGAHAALVVRRALHPPAGAPEHGPLADLRGDVPGRPVPRLPHGHQLARREHARHRARARPRRLRQEQPAVRALPRAWPAATSSSRPRRTRTASSTPIEQHGMERVEAVLDAALALESHIDVDQRAAPRRAIPSIVAEEATQARDAFQKRFGHLPGERAAGDAPPSAARAAMPPHPEYDLLWFIAHYAPELEAGSATSSSRCARSRSTSTRCSPARS